MVVAGAKASRRRGRL